MRSLWDDKEAKSYSQDPLQTRVYSSRLLGKEPALVLHGGGNTSVKTTVTNLFGESEPVLYVKGSGWDLATIEAAGYAPVRLDVLQKLAALDHLSDSDMVRMQKSAMLDPAAPSPSIEAILHAIIPFQFVDHTHADAVITITNTDNGKQRIKDIYGERVLVVPYVMPGFILAKTIYTMTQSLDWSQLDGMVLMNHGVFSFADDAKSSYERMIDIVTKAENYLTQQHATLEIKSGSAELSHADLVHLASARQQVSQLKGAAMLARVNNTADAVDFSRINDIASICDRGPLTPDHIIRTKRTPVVLSENIKADMDSYALAYQQYFESNTNGQLTCLDKAPRWAVWPGKGLIAFGPSVKDADIIADISAHTIDAIQMAEKLGGWRALPEKDLFDIEYWELEQAKLKKSSASPSLQGKVAVVSGAASGIGKACVEALQQHGAAVAALDLDPAINERFSSNDIIGIQCDVSDEQAIANAIHQTVANFGGIDILVNNAGIFPASEDIAELRNDTWQRSLDVNLSGHQLMLKHCLPFLEKGIDAAVIMMASKNVPAPGPGAAAYSVAKAGLTQLARVAALELASKNIRVQILHPDAVFDTGIWTDEVLQKRAEHYAMSVQQYKTKNLLHVEISSKDVAELVCALAGPLFYKSTGVQIPIDGGNDRVI
ncbi:bifunctional aldolase/short-chain dehydrogenase [Kaarinaea lacus]